MLVYMYVYTYAYVLMYMCVYIYTYVSCIHIHMHPKNSDQRSKFSAMFIAHRFVSSVLILVCRSLVKTFSQYLVSQDACNSTFGIFVLFLITSNCKELGRPCMHSLNKGGLYCLAMAFLEATCRARQPVLGPR